MGGRARCWRCPSSAVEPKAWLRGKAELRRGSCRQQMHLQPGRSQPGGASSSAQLLHTGARKTGQQQPVPPLPCRPGKGIAGFLGHGCRKGKKDEPSPPRLHPSPAGWAGPEELVPEQMPVGRSQHPAARPAGKPGWQEGGETGMEGEHIHHKAQSFSVQSAPHRLGATGTNSGELISGK